MRDIAKVSATTHDYTLLKRLSDPERTSSPGTADALLRESTNGSHQIRKGVDLHRDRAGRLVAETVGGDLVANLMGAIAKSHAFQSLDFSAVSGGARPGIHVNRMLCDVVADGGQREQLVQKIASRGRVGTTLEKLLH